MTLAADDPPQKAGCTKVSAVFVSAKAKVDATKERLLSRLAPRNRTLVEHYSELTWSQLVAMVPLTLLQVGRWGFDRAGARRPLLVPL